MKQRPLIVDPEFRDLIPPLTNEEFNQLRDNIIEDCEVREPIVTWNGVILDGHNRWKIIQEHPEINYKTMELMFGSRNEAKAWMIRNQLGRRHLPNYERARLALQLKPLLAEEAKKRQGERNDLKDAEEGDDDGDNFGQKSDRSSDTKHELAKVAGVSHDTIHKVDVIEQKATPEVKELLRKGEVSVNKVYNDIRQAEREEEPPEEESKAPTYTVDNLLSEISAGSENYIRFLRQTLTNRSTVYAAVEDRKRVHNAVLNLRMKIEEIENLLK